MKNFTLSLLCVFTLSGFAQSTETFPSEKNFYSKRGFYILPEQGDISLGISATPFFKYMSSVFGDDIYMYQEHGSSSYSTYYYQHADIDSRTYTPSFAFTAQNPGSVYFKYMLQENMALRVIGIFGFSSQKLESGSGFGSKTNELKSTGFSMGILIGQTFYRQSKSRLKGYLGYQAGFMKIPYEGVAAVKDSIAEDGTPYYVPVTATGKVEYTDGINASDNYTITGGNTLSIIGSGYIGAEFFFAPKMSIGGEFEFGLRIDKQGEREYEPKNGAKYVVVGGNRTIDFKPVASGELILHLYF